MDNNDEVVTLLRNLGLLNICNTVQGNHDCIHTGIRCSVCCSQDFIIGNRYTCLSCNNINICETCFKANKLSPYKFHELCHPLVQFSSPYNDKIGNFLEFSLRYGQQTNSGQYCAGCQYQTSSKNDIVGLCFKCSKCPNFNLCWKCVETKSRTWGLFSRHDLSKHSIYATITTSTSSSNSTESASTTEQNEVNIDKPIHLEHIGVKCGVCGDEEFCEDRYRCTVCLNFDLCSHCFQNHQYKKPHTPKHPVMPIFIPLTDNENQSLISELSKLSIKYRSSKHELARCRVCQVPNIIGLRFVCQQCPKFDLCFECSKCKTYEGKHEATHQLIVFKEPYPPRINPDDIKCGPLLGKGSFGYVYKASYKPFNFSVACKVISIPNELSGSKKKQLVASFHKEVANNSYVINNSIIKLYGYCTKELKNGMELLYIMEHMAGGKLTSLIQKPNEFSLYGKLRILLDVALCMKHMHVRQYAHRDLRPDNILLSKRGRVKVSDIGISKLVDDTNEHSCNSASISFNNRYLPPEFSTGNYDSFKLDVFIFGLTMFELLVGYKVNRQQTFLETSPILWDLVQECTNFEPNNRPTPNRIVSTLSICLDEFNKEINRRQLKLDSLSIEEKNRLIIDKYPEIRKLTDNFLKQQDNNALYIDTDGKIQTSISYIERRVCKAAIKIVGGLIREDDNNRVSDIPDNYNGYQTFNPGSILQVNEPVFFPSGSMNPSINSTTPTIVNQQFINSSLDFDTSVKSRSGKFVTLFQGGAGIQAIHKNTTCTFCGATDFVSSRYICTTCQNTNICGDCFDACRESNEHRNEHAVLFIPFPLISNENCLLKVSHTSLLRELLNEPETVFHEQKCQLCSSDIRGLRFQCNYCQDYNLCKKCYLDFKYVNKHSPNHQIIIFKHYYPPILKFDDIEMEKDSFAAGRFGNLYKAVLKPYNFNIACRIVNINNDNHQLRVMKEISNARNIRHNGIVKFYGQCLESTEKHCVLQVTEYMDKGNLLQFITSNSKELPYSKKLKYLLNIAVCLQNLHCKSYSHNNLKLENILVNSHDEIKLGDGDMISSKVARIESSQNEGTTSMDTTGSIFSTLEMSNIKNMVQNDILYLGLILNFVITEIQHQTVNNKPRLIQHSPLFFDIIAACMKETSENAPTSAEIALTIGFHYFYFSFYLKQQNLNYHNLDKKEKNDIFHNIYVSIMQKKCQLFKNTKQRHFKTRQPLSVWQIELWVREFCKLHENVGADSFAIYPTSANLSNIQRHENIHIISSNANSLTSVSSHNFNENISKKSTTVGSTSEFNNFMQTVEVSTLEPSNACAEMTTWVACTSESSSICTLDENDMTWSN